MSVIHLAVHGALGRMGARVCTLARDDPRFDLVTQIDQKGNGADGSNAAARVDVVIDFSTDEGARGAVEYALRHDAALMIGTTGLLRQTLSVIEVAAQTTAVMVAPNTSAGVAVLNYIAAEAARLLGPAFSIDLVEVHHAAKRDAPSGTALRIAETLRRRAGVELPAERIHALRAGDVVGEHTVEIIGNGERLRLAHIATNRDLFARGALDAAAWLHGRPPGQYTIEQALGLPI